MQPNFADLAKSYPACPKRSRTRQRQTCRFAAHYKRIIGRPFLAAAHPKPGPVYAANPASRIQYRIRLYIMTMTKVSLNFLSFLLVLAGVVYAQPTSTSPDPKTGAEMTGTIKEYTAGSLLVLETLAPSEPVQFKLSKNVTYADTDGKTIEAAGLATNRKVRVHYNKVGGDNVADKVTLIGN
jgi:hypothetical protein